jgi:CRP/FNR family cyclic AMP-dependent transcriptional regulator
MEAGSFWHRLNDAERTTFMELSRIRRYGPGEVLVRADKNRSVAVVRRGRIRVMEGTRILATRQAGDIVGEQALLGGRSPAMTVVAVTEVQALVLDKRGLDRILNRHPGVLRVLCAVMSERLDEAGRKLADHGDSAITKVARHLVLSVDFRRIGGSGVTVHIKSQAALGDSLGVSRDSVVRALQRLRTEDVVTTHRGAVTIRDLQRLRVYAAG